MDLRKHCKHDVNKLIFINIIVVNRCTFSLLDCDTGKFFRFFFEIISYYFYELKKSFVQMYILISD